MPWPPYGSSVLGCAGLWITLLNKHVEVFAPAINRLELLGAEEETVGDAFEPL